jgi:hypothetical protein
MKRWRFLRGLETQHMQKVNSRVYQPLFKVICSLHIVACQCPGKVIMTSAIDFPEDRLLFAFLNDIAAACRPYIGLHACMRTRNAKYHFTLKTDLFWLCFPGWGMGPTRTKTGLVIFLYPFPFQYRKETKTAFYAQLINQSIRSW